jgi:hypothetical protein
MPAGEKLGPTQGLWLCCSQAESTEGSQIGWGNKHDFGARQAGVEKP